jgi:hypothetical protein
VEGQAVGSALLLGRIRAAGRMEVGIGTIVFPITF